MTATTGKIDIGKKLNLFHLTWPIFVEQFKIKLLS